MPVPAGLSVDELKQRLDLEGAISNEFLENLLVASFLQAQAPWPHGCGRLLAPDPPLVPGEGDDPPTDTANPVTRQARVRRRRRVVVPDARAITAVTVDGAATAWEVNLERSGLIVQIDLADTIDVGDPANTQMTVAITGRFGFLELPENLKGAIYEHAARGFHERDARYADQVAIAEGGGVQSYYRQLLPSVRLAFASYRLPDGLGSLA